MASEQASSTVVPPVPGMTYRSLCRSLSAERLAAYSLETDLDSEDAPARYLWNLALCAQLHPVFHIVEVAFRNALYNIGEQETRGRGLKYQTVACWLDANPTLLKRAEAEDVANAVHHLGTRHTPGHLISQLGFGFWVRLCDAPYEQGNKAGPRLWPRATTAFAYCPKSHRNRSDISRAFDALRNMRNDIAHHHPVWDRSPTAYFNRAVDLLAWMNPTLAAVTRTCSQFMAVHTSGPAAFRAVAKQVVSVCR